MDKQKILQFAVNYIAWFQDPRYNPYDFENYLKGLKTLGFRPDYDTFTENHPEIVTPDGIDALGAATKNAISIEQDIGILGNFIFAYALSESKSAFCAADVDFSWHIEPLKRLAELCRM